MTAAAEPQRQSVTDGGDVRMRARAADHLRLVPDPGSESPGFAHARAIPNADSEIKEARPSKVRNFASTHAGEALGEAKRIWFVTERPESLEAVAKEMGNLPGGVGAGTLHIAAGIVRLAVYSVAYLVCFAVGTNVRVGVTFCLTVATIAAAALVGLAGQ